jgi:hypothetical protein
MKSFRVLNPKLSGQVARGFCALAVMTKAPQAGQVKTRLVPPLKPDEAAELNKCFLRDTTAAISNATTNHQACGVAVYTPVGAESAFVNLLPAGFSLLPQRGTGFGERLYYATDDLFKCGFGSVCLIDSDSPTVLASSFSQAVRKLAESGDRVVLGPCEDGGYYLIGLKNPHRELFDEIDWSTERVLDQTTRRAREIRLEVKLLAPGNDVDDAGSLGRLCEELLGDKSTSAGDIAPNTRRFLSEIVAHEGRDRIWPE